MGVVTSESWTSVGSTLARTGRGSLPRPGRRNRPGRCAGRPADLLQLLEGMSYAFETSEPVGPALTRIAHEQIDKALASIDEEGPHEAVHEARRRCKKVRAALRLVRPALDDYADANAFFRDTARLISELRDATAHLETLDAIREHHGGAIDEEALGALRRAMLSERERRSTEQDIGDRLMTVRDRLVEGKRRAADWVLDEGGFEAVSGGLEKTYRRARQRAEKAQERDDAKSFHQWRKRVKYHRYHVKMLRRCFPELLEAREAASHDLTDLLGDEHDRAVLQQFFSETGLADDHQSITTVIAGLAAVERERLRERSRPLGYKLFIAEDASSFVARVGQWWEVSRRSQKTQSSSA